MRRESLSLSPLFTMFSMLASRDYAAMHQRSNACIVIALALGLACGDPRAGASTSDSGATSETGSSSGSGGSSDTETSAAASLVGYILFGASPRGVFGQSVAAVGDVNGDGLSDLAIGAPSATIAEHSNAGQGFVVFGRDQAENVAVNELDGHSGLRIDGVYSPGQLGSSVMPAGDVNGDGFADVMITSPQADANGDVSGQVCIIFGSDAPFPASMQEDALDGRGVRLIGDGAHANIGNFVAPLGDIDGDGFADVIVSTYWEKTYIVFGAPDLTDLVLTPDLPATGAAIMLNLAARGRPGDVNGDGVTDLIFSKAQVEGEPLRTYVVFVDADTLADLDLADVGVTRPGIVLEHHDDVFYYYKAIIGDINGDGAGDITFSLNLSQFAPKETYVVYGNTESGVIDVVEATSTGRGFIIRHDMGLTPLRTPVPIGDVNGDGLNDVAFGASPNIVIVYGQTIGTTVTDAGLLDGTRGRIIRGPDIEDFALPIDGGVDLNLDGHNDLIAGAVSVDDYAGRTYVLFGPDFVIPEP